MRAQKYQEVEVTSLSFCSTAKQRSDRKEADDIISRVEDAQTDPKQITKERPASAKYVTILCMFTASEWL